MAKKAMYEGMRKQVGSINHIVPTANMPNASLFKAVFEKEKVTNNLFADQGTDGNFISTSLLNEIKK